MKILKAKFPGISTRSIMIKRFKITGVSKSLKVYKNLNHKKHQADLHLLCQMKLSKLIKESY